MDGQQYDEIAPVNGFARGVLIASLITFTVALLVMGGCTAVKADTVNRAESPRTGQPYGGCWEAYRYVQSQGAQDCRDLGWRVRGHVVVNPRGAAWTDLKRCRVEDSGHCYWNAGRRGNHRGLSFVNTGSTNEPHLVYVQRFR